MSNDLKRSSLFPVSRSFEIDQPYLEENVCTFVKISILDETPKMILLNEKMKSSYLSP
jgi:hypothetical protein